jgi:hypothetical protein
MRFLFTLNMASYKHQPIQQIIGEHPASGCDEMCELLNSTDFIVVEQYYHLRDTDENPVREWRYKGPVILNSVHIGKVQIYSANEGKNRKDED